jgi:biotin operon repressor
MDSLIAMKATGSPEEFACKMSLSRSMLFETLQEMKEMGVDIRYSNSRETYYYADFRRIVIKVAKTIDEQ